MVSSQIRKTPPTRKDARENRARLLEAAREVFASSGFDAPLSEVASRAGVGRATLYRNFPDRVALAAAIFEDNLAELEALADAHRGQAKSFITLLETIVEQQIQVHSLFRMLLAGASDTPDVNEPMRRIKAVLGEPLREAKAEGIVRDDLSLRDVIDMLTMIAAVLAAETSPISRQARAERALTLLLDGIVPRGC